MQYYGTFSEILRDYKNLHYPGGIYVEAGKKYTIQDTSYWVISSKEEKDQDQIDSSYGPVPESLSDFNVQSFLDTGTFQDIIENRLEQQETMNLESASFFADAINYYLREDDFIS